MNQGYKNVSTQKEILEIFSGISNKYDLMNDVMSFGLHRLWKRKFASMILDVVLKKKIEKMILHESFHVDSEVEKDDSLRLEDALKDIVGEDSQADNDAFCRSLDNTNKAENDVNSDDSEWQKKRKYIYLIDTASGTCDIPIYLTDMSRKMGIEECDMKIIASEPNREMKTIGKDKSIDANCLQVNVVGDDATKLNFSDECFDIYTISFGIRNIVDKDKALSEAYRVLVHGGEFFCMEFAQPNFALKPFYNVYNKIIPKLGKLIANNSSAYKYLVDSIEMFPAPIDFCKMIRKAGFKNVGFTNISRMVNIYRGTKK